MSTPSGKRVSLPHSERKAPHNATDHGRTKPQQVISVSLIVRRKNPLSLKDLGGRRVSRAQFDETYAGNPADFESIRQFAHQHALSVDESASSLARRTVVLRGTAEAMEKAFGVELHDYEHNGKLFHGFTGTLSLPEAHAPLVEAVLGLDARPIAKPHYRLRREAEHGVATPAAAGASYSPIQVAQLYNFPTSANGSGQTIGIIELGGGYNPSDLTSYFTGLGIATPPTVVAVSVDGGANSPTTPDSADGEVCLDIEVAGAIAPGAKLAVYFTPNTDQGFIDAITTAVHDTSNNPSVISISWGGPESSWSQSALTALDNACASAGALGITITVAAGDDGSSDGVSDGSNNVDFPASSPHVLACGGTRLVGSGSTISSETVWNDGSNGSTGGGYSVSFPVPSWQTGVIPSGSTGRGVPDVAGDASPTTGYNVLVDGQSLVVGGTSAVAPLWAALIALINQQHGSSVGFVNPTLYANPGAFHDITSGSNGAYSAGPGWDACTGMGSPIGTSVATALGAPAPVGGGSGSGSGSGSGTGGSGGTGGGTGGSDSGGGSGSGGGKGSGKKHHPKHGHGH